MAEETNTMTQTAAQQEQQSPVATQQAAPTGPTEAERRRQSARDRQNNRAERARRPGATVFIPESPAVTFEVMYNVRRIDQALASLERNVFQNGADMSKIQKAGAAVEKLKTMLTETAKELHGLAGITYTEYRQERSRR